MKGVALPIPGDKMVCILLDQPTEFRQYRAILEDEPLVADSFFARGTTSTCTQERLDGPYTAFIKQTQPIYQSGMDRAALLDGTAKRKVTMTVAELARYRHFGTLGTIVGRRGRARGRVARRHTAVARGRRHHAAQANVVVPQWAMFGMAAFFETPKGPFPANPLDASVAFYPGIGAQLGVPTARSRRWTTKRNSRRNPSCCDR